MKRFDKLFNALYFCKIQSGNRKIMRKELSTKIIEVCNKKIQSKGENVGLSFYAFFANKNDNPELLMEVATWWIQTHKLDHFVKAHKIKKMIEEGM
jgi:hypothetical protein